MTATPVQQLSPGWFAAMCVSMGCVLAPSLHAQTQTSFRVVHWEPSAGTVHRQDANGGIHALVKAQNTIRASEKICMGQSNQGQTLVQVQPSEGGDTRFVVLGGRMPACRAVGEGWAAAKSSESVWFAKLFAVLGSESGTRRISASAPGATRGTDATVEAQPADKGECGLYPAHRGLILLQGGSVALRLGTTLPEGSAVGLLLAGSADNPARTAIVRQGHVQWASSDFQTGQTWRITHQSAQGKALQNCSEHIEVRPANANPLNVAIANKPDFSADDATVHATLVAAQLDDANLIPWHAWLLSTLAPENSAANDLGVALWRSWWGANQTRSQTAPAAAR